MYVGDDVLAVDDELTSQGSLALLQHRSILRGVDMHAANLRSRRSSVGRPGQVDRQRVSQVTRCLL